jgi:hypothetical protein
LTGVNITLSKWFSFEPATKNQYKYAYSSFNLQGLADYYSTAIIPIWTRRPLHIELTNNFNLMTIFPAFLTLTVVDAIGTHPPPGQGQAGGGCFA